MASTAAEIRRTRRPRGSFVRDVLEVRGPVRAHEHPQQPRGRDRVRGVIEEADRQEAEHERPRLAPEPEILMQRVEQRVARRAASRDILRDAGSRRPAAWLRCVTAMLARDARCVGARSHRLALRSGDRLSVLARVREEGRLGSAPRDHALRGSRSGSGSSRTRRCAAVRSSAGFRRGSPGKPVFVFETGGTTGVPKTRVAIDDFRTDYEIFSETLPDEFFPKGSNWLMLGPSGPRRLRLSVEHLAQYPRRHLLLRRSRSALGRSS